MSNMAEVNGTDHLVRHEKETKLNGYDNEGFHSQERSEDEEESASDDDRLRAVVTENGHRSDSDSHLSNGHVHEESNVYSTTVNGSAVIVIEEGKEDSNMNDNNKDDSSHKPLDTRLHHYVPVNDIDRKILNGSDGTHVTIPEDAVINFTTGRVKVKKGASNNQPVTNDRESIPLETMLPSYEAEDKIGLGGEKAELEAELANHKNGLWSEGHNAYSNPEAPFGNSEKLNGTSKSSDEVSLPVNNHRKCLRGEKLYFTEENRKLCPGWRRVFVCGLILIILAVALLLGVLAATGILLAESESKNTRYESGHSLPSIDSMSHAGHSFRPQPSPKVPQKSLPPVTEDADFPLNSTISGVGDTVSRPPSPTVSSKVPVLNDSSYSQTIVPNALVGEFTIDENFTEDLKDRSSEGYQSLAKYIERELHGILKRNGGVFEELKILDFSPGSIKIKFVAIWTSDHNIILSQKAVEIMKSYLRKNHNSLLAYPVDMNSIHFIDVFDECRVQKGGCSFDCIWHYDTLTKSCICEENMILLADGKSCGPKPLKSDLETTTPKLIYISPSSTSTSITELPLLTKESPESTAMQSDVNFLITTQIPSVTKKSMVTISELFNEITTTESATSINEITSIIQNTPTTSESFLLNSETTAETLTSEEPTTINKHVFTTENFEITSEVVTEMPTISDSPLLENTNFSKESDTTVNVSIVSNLSSDATTSILGLEPTTVKLLSNSSFWNASKHTETYTVIPDLTENQNDSTPITMPTVEYHTIQNENEDKTTIGYHIVEETTEMYTLKEDINSEFGNINITVTPDFNNTTEELEITSSTTTLQENNEITVSEHTTEVLLATEMFVTESSMDSAVSGVNDYDTTEMSNYHITNVTLDVGDTEYYTTVKAEENFTDAVNLKEGTDNILADEVLNDATTVTNKFLSNESKEFETTTASPLTTFFSIPPIIPQLNRTPEVRSFDDEVQNDTNTQGTDFSTDGTAYETHTEVTTYADNSSTIELSAENLLTSSPFTTSLPSVESVSETTLPVNSSTESTSLETTINTITENINDNKHISSTEKSIAETTVDFTNFFVEDAETVVNTEQTMEHTTQNPNSFDVISDIMNDAALDTTISTHGSHITMLPPTEIEFHNETFELTENTNVVLNESYTIENSTVINTTLYFSASENTTNDKEIIENVTNSVETIANLYNNTTVMESFETTVPNVETYDNITTVENNNDDDISNTTVEPTNTEHPLLFTTSEYMNTSNDQTFETDMVSTIISEADDLYNSNISNEEIIGNTTLTNLSSAVHFNKSEGTNIEDTTYIDISNSTHLANTEENYTLTIAQDYTLPTPPTYINENEENTTKPNYDIEIFTTVEYSNDTLFPEDLGYDSNFTHTISMSYESSFEGIHSTLLPGLNESVENNTFIDNFENFTTDGYENVINETTTNVSTGIECREDQFLCEPLNKCINNTFMCDGIGDCPDGLDEFECKDTCHSNFMCANSSTCIMSDARCDGIWDCENGTDEENCTPTECAKHEVMCLDGSKCIKPGHICDWKYNCLDRSDEVGCVERTTCESSGRFFCNDGLCIPWSLKCDGEHDCKEGEDEGNCTCLNDEFQCNDGKCLKSSSRCDGHKDCYDADDEMGCVNVDIQHIVSTYEPYSGTWGLLCAEDWNFDDGQYLCQELGFGRVSKVERVHVSFNGTWMAMRRENLTESSLWTERVSFVESCTSGLAASVECDPFGCGEYTGLLHRRRRDVISSSSSQWPFIGYTSTFHSNKGCLSEILTPIWLITSAECLLSISKEPFNGSDWYVRTNIGRNVEADVAQNHEVLRIITHPHSSKFRSLTLRDYDVALIRLKYALVFVDDKIGAICLPDEQVPPGITCFSGVLGTEKPRAPPPQTLTINSLALQIIDKRNCNRVDHFNNTINQRMLCTQSSEGHTICDNDEGTPLMCLSGINKWFLAGMLTYQRFCDVYNKHPAVFSNLFSMRKFLDQVTGQKQYEIPYDSSIYVIIPPTTPSPTLPETTTIMTTISTTEITLKDTTQEFENITESTYDVLEVMNNTTAVNEELFREENDTTTPLEEFTTLTTITDDGILNENVTIPYGTDFDVINTTLEESEKIKDEFSTNRTHNYLMSLLNDTYTSDDINITDIVITDNNTEFNNATSPYLQETTTISLDLTNMPMTFELNISNTSEIKTSSERDVTTVISTDLMDTLMNETTVNSITTDNMIVDSTLNDSTDNLYFTTLNFTEAIATDLPLVNIFNESLEVFKPMIALANESKVISQPLMSINNTTEMEKDGFESLEPFENSTESMGTESSLPETSTNVYDQVTTAATMPTNLLPIKEETESENLNTEMTDIPMSSDATEAFTFEVESQPNDDLAFSIFKNSDELKFEPYSLLENNNTSNFSEKHMAKIETQENTNMTTNFLYVTETSSLSPVTTTIFPMFVSNATELNDFEFNNTMKETNKKSRMILDNTNYTVPMSFETEATSEAANISLSNIERYENIINPTESNVAAEDSMMKMHLITEEIEHYENITNPTESNVAAEDSMMKMHLITEEIRVLSDNSSSFSNTDCGVWDDNFAMQNNNNSKNFFTKWPALGYLQMVSEPKICPSAVISPKFVITSLNCLTLSDKNLDPDKWTYIGGLYQPNITSNTTQTHTVKKIILYPDQSSSPFLNERDVALVRVNDLEMNKYSRSVCLAEDDATSGKECFTVGWSKNSSDDGLQNQFYSIPLSIISTSECNNTMNYNGMLMDYLICGNHKESIHTCELDFGSPLFCRNENNYWEIQGILNFSGPCDMAQPTVFSSIASVRKWINDTLINYEKFLQS